MRSFNLISVLAITLATFAAAAPVAVDASPALLAERMVTIEARSTAKSRAAAKKAAAKKAAAKKAAAKKAAAKKAAAKKAAAAAAKKKAAATKKAATTKKISKSDSSSYSGKGTWYTQDGTTGACGKKYSDSSKVVALNLSQYGSANSVSSWCGKSVTITNTANGKSTTATIADACPGCASKSLDLSLATFKAIGSLDTGVLSIEWSA